jgi:LuxR family maltose regulon positive regulatory protein
MAGPDDSTAFELSQQEMRVLQMLLADHTAEEIARRLSLSMETIRSHMRRIYRKMNVHSRDEMMRVARAAGLNR